MGEGRTAAAVRDDRPFCFFGCGCGRAHCVGRYYEGGLKVLYACMICTRHIIIYIQSVVTSRMMMLSLSARDRSWALGLTQSRSAAFIVCGIMAADWMQRRNVLLLILAKFLGDVSFVLYFMYFMYLL